MTRTVLAKAFLHNPAVVLLDEPTASLDPDVSATIRAFILEQRKHGTAFLITSHNMAEVAELSDRVLVMQRGRIIADSSPNDLVASISRAYIRLMVRDTHTLLAFLVENGFMHSHEGNTVCITLDEQNIASFLQSIATRGISYEDITIQRPTLEDYFLSLAQKRSFMKWHRIQALLLRHGYQSVRDFNKTVPIIYWALLDVVLFGLTGLWLAPETAPHDLAALISGVVLWQIIIRANLNMALTVLEEIWAHNIVNLFTTPLSIGEWIAAAAIEGGLTSIVVTFLCSVTAWYLYGTSLLALGIPTLIWMSFILFASGVSIGLFSASLLVLWGNRVQSMVWMFGWLFAPLSTAYYAPEVLPVAIKHLTYVFPMVYVFDTLRIFTADGLIQHSLLIYGSVLALIWLGTLIVLFHRAFARSTNAGLARLVD